MYFPDATNKTAFLAGLSLTVLTRLIDVAKSQGLISWNADNPEVFPFVLVYFFVTVLVLVIGIRNLAPKELGTRIPFVYFPTDREGVKFMFRGWGRMFIWFLGAASGIAVTIPIAYFAYGRI
jgi:hypothetical protein